MEELRNHLAGIATETNYALNSLIARLQAIQNACGNEQLFNELYGAIVEANNIREQFNAGAGSLDSHIESLISDTATE